MAKRRQQAARDRAAADRARRAAEELTGRPGGAGADGELDRWQPRSPMPTTDDIPLDLNGDEGTGPVAGEWFGPSAPGAPGTSAPARPSPGDVARVRRSAEQAIEDAAVPARYHDFIRRYFRSFERTADQPAP